MSTPPTQTLVTLPTHPAVSLPAGVTGVSQPLSDLGPKLLFLVTIFDAGMNEIGCGASDTVTAAASNAVDDVWVRRCKDFNWNACEAADARDARMRR